MTTAPETAPLKPLSRWVWAGPLLVVAVMVSGKLGWDAWQHQQFEKERLETPPQEVADLKLKLVWIPAGTFTMGTGKPLEWVNDLKSRYNKVKPGGWTEWKLETVIPDETPSTRVRLTKGFYLGETEVTQAQWETVMGNNPSEFKKPNRPVDRVSWDECMLFCRMLTEREHAAGRLGAKEIYRLPTEAEWEYACRAGGTGKYAFGDDERRLGDYGWNVDTSEFISHEVGTKKANAWGLYDMHGNVWEWCGVWYGAYPGGFVDDPRGEESGASRVVRGGSWGDGAGTCRSAVRNLNSPERRNYGNGFRLVRSLVP